MNAPTLGATLRAAKDLPPVARIALAYLRHEHGRGPWTTATLELDAGLVRESARAAVTVLLDHGLAREAPEAGPRRYTLTPAGRGGAK